MKEINYKDMKFNPFNLIGDEWMLVTAGDENSCNTMTASWGHLGCLWGQNDPTAVIYLRPSRYTKEFVDEEGYFSLCVMDKSFKKQMAYLGSVSGRDEDKIGKAGLTPVYADNTVYFEEAKLVLICKKLYQSELQESGFLYQDTKFMKEECLICKAPLEYLEADELMECAICHKKENSKTRCVKGHYVCNDCHTAGLDSIIGLCLNETSKNPVYIIKQMMALPFCHMHGPEHHVMVGSALLTAYKNAGGQIDLQQALSEMMNRGKSVPGGACGFWGACGAGISSGMFVSIISKSTPLAKEPFALAHKMTAKSLGEIGNIGGPRCCKRDSYLSVLSAIDYVKEHFNIEMEKPIVVCEHSKQNNQCIGIRCPFFKRQ